MSTVLVVEDDRDLRDLARRHLERAGHAVLSTGSGAEGLRRRRATDVQPRRAHPTSSAPTAPTWCRP